MGKDKCSICGDDLAPEEVQFCWQCEPEIGPGSGAAALVALMAYLMLAGIR